MKDNNPLWLAVIGVFIPLAAALVTQVWNTFARRGFRAKVKADAEILSHLPEQSRTREALLVSVDNRIATMLEEPKPQVHTMVLLMRLAWSVVAVGALALGGLIAYVGFVKHGYVGESPILSPPGVRARLLLFGFS
jgi:hypothetical protein